MSQANSELHDLLKRAKELLVEGSTNYAKNGNWDRAQAMLEWARQVEGIKEGVHTGNGQMREPTHRPAQSLSNQRTSPVPPGASLPYYYIQSGTHLAKVGASRDGGTYEHRVTRANYDLILQKIIAISKSAVDFETQRLVDSCPIPKHEPLIVVAVLEQQGVLIKLRRGRWVFANTKTVEESVTKIWNTLPRR